MKRRLYAAASLALLCVLWPLAGEHRLAIAATAVGVIVTGGK